MQQLPITIREAYPEEHPFIYNSWIKSGYRSTVYCQVPLQLYTLNQHQTITGLLERCKVLVVQELGKPESIFAYIVYDVVDGVFVCHYAYTKQTWRRLGLLRALLDAASYNDYQTSGFYTHMTRASLDVGHKLNLYYNPYQLINPRYAPWSAEIANKVNPPKALLGPETFRQSDAMAEQVVENLNLKQKKGTYHE